MRFPILTSLCPSQDICEVLLFTQKRYITPFHVLSPSLPPSGQVSLVTVEPLNDTSARVTWTRLESRDVSGYRVYYLLVDGISESRRRRQSLVEGNVRVSSEEDSVVVGGLEEGGQYRFEVAVLVVVSGVEREGRERLEGPMLQVGGVQGEWVGHGGVV